MEFLTCYWKLFNVGKKNRQQQQQASEKKSM